MAMDETQIKSHNRVTKIIWKKELLFSYFQNMNKQIIESLNIS